MLRVTAFLFLIPVAAVGDLLNPAVNPSLFNVTTFASSVAYPEGIVQVPDGSIAVETSPGCLFAPGQLLRFVDVNGVASGAPAVLHTAANHPRSGSGGLRFSESSLRRKLAHER